MYFLIGFYDIIYDSKVKERLQVVNWVEKHPTIAFVVALVGLLVFQFGPTMLRGEPVLGHDAVSQFEPWYAFASESVRNGELPLWDPYTFSGHPFLANPQVALFYPPNWLYLLAPNPATLELITILHIFLFGIFAYLFGKEMGLSDFPAALAALVLSLSEYTAARMWAGHVDVLTTAAWLPLLFHVIRRLSTNASIRNIIAGMLCTTMLLLAGFLQVAYQIFFAGGLFALYLLVFEVPKEYKLRVIATYALMILGGLALASIQLLPTYELLQHSSRGEGVSFSFATQQSLPPWFLLTLFAPDFFLTAGPIILDPITLSEIFKSEVALYIGAVPLLLAVFAVMTRFRDRRVVFFVLLAILFGLLSMGKFTPLYSFFYEVVPGYNRFRIPAHHWLIVVFSLSILMGLGVERLWQVRAKVIGVYKMALVTLISLEVAVVLGFALKDVILGTVSTETVGRTDFQFFSLSTQGIEHLFRAAYESALYSLWMPSLQLTALCLWWIFLFRSGRRENTARVALGFLLVAGLFASTLRLANPNLSFYRPVVPSIPLIEQEFQSQKGRYRVLLFEKDFSSPLTSAVNGLGLQEKVEIVNGYDPIVLGDYLRYVRLIVDPEADISGTDQIFTTLARPQLLDLLNVRLVVSGKPLPDDVRFDLELIGEENGVWLYRNPQARPRAYFVEVNDMTVARDQAESFARLTTETAPAFALIESDRPKAGEGLVSNWKSANSVDQNEVLISEYRNNLVRINVQAAEPGYLVLSDLYYPGWSVYVNGIPQEILRANAIFRAVPIESGEHVVEFRYLPGTLLLGAGISGVSLALLLALGFTSLWKGRRTANRTFPFSTALKPQ